MKIKKIYLWPASLAVIYLASILIIATPDKSKQTLIQPSPTPVSNINYKCPKSEWVDCMPGPGPTKTECSQKYLQWAKDKCPKFKGVAY